MYIIICCEFGNGNYTLSNVVISPLLHAYIIVQMISETKREDLCSVFCVLWILIWLMFSIITIGQQQPVLPRESIHKQAQESDQGRLSLISNNSAIICPIQSKSRVKASPLWIAKGPAWGQRVAFWWVSGSKTSTIGRTGLHNSEG